MTREDLYQRWVDQDHEEFQYTGVRGLDRLQFFIDLAKYDEAEWQREHCGGV